MIPLALQLSNFMSYRTPTTIDFSNVRIACLSGDNGAGKSALLDAMTWAVWGKSRAPSDRDVITLGESQMEVTFDFRLQERDYRVFRRIVRRGADGGRTSPTLEFYVREPEAVEWLTISGDNIRETEKKIVSTLKMDYETFVNSAFLMQGKADTFTQKRPGDRKKILADILNLGEYDVLAQMARDEERALRSRSSHLSSLIERIQEQLDERPAIEAELEQLSQRLVEAGSAVDRLETESRALQDALNAMAGLIRNRSASEARLGRNRKRLAELESALKTDQAAFTRFQSIIDRSGDIERAFADLRKWRSVAESCAEILRQRQPVETQLRNIERTIERTRNEVQRQIDQHRNAEKQAMLAIDALATSDKELRELTSQVAEISQITTRLDEVRRELQDLESESARLTAECHILKESMEQIQNNLALLESGEAECPVCRRPMRDGEHEHVETLWRREGKELGDQFREHRKRIKEIQKQISALTAEGKKLDATRTTLSQKQAVIGRLEQELARRPQLEQQRDDAAREAERLTATLSNGSLAPDLTEQADLLTARLQELTYDAEQAIQADKEIKRLTAAESEYAELQTARVRHETLRETIADRERAIADAREDVEALEREICDISKELESEPELRERLERITDELDKVRGERDALQGAFGAAENRLEHLDRLAEEQTAHKATIGTMALDADAYRELATAFGRNGIQAMIVETILPELQDEANRLLARMTTGHLHVNFRTTRQALTNDNIIETLDIIIRDESGERPYAMYSGGEAFRIDFAIRVALSKLLARRSGATIDMLIIDEGFGTQDARGRDGLVEAIQSVESDFATILVITHIDEIRDMFPTRIDVVKTDMGSQVTVA